MAKKKNYLDELIEYQKRPYTSSAKSLQKGELPYTTRQLLKYGEARYIYIMVLAAPLSLALLLWLGSHLQMSKMLRWFFATLWVAVMALGVAHCLRADRRLRDEEKARKEQLNRRRKKRKKKK